ncbi:hypothetical protein PAXY110619_30195 [Paenibacillus xylanexedens]|uniref:Uncharacterized protein n=1 Tax=Paenibacillus xylanexedens TaxID=528191 RepID=A0ABS4RN14_PAEXY|nr:hypothetical protein [Paenibacillus xylanexedens]
MTLQNLFHEKPTKLWNERMIEGGDELFTEERLLMSDQALDTYLHQLKKRKIISYFNNVPFSSTRTLILEIK